MLRKTVTPAPIDAYLDDVKSLVVILTVLAAALSVGGVYWGAVGTVRKYRELRSALARLDGIAHDSSIPDDQRTSMRHAILRPSGNWGMVEYFDEHAQLNALTLVVEGLKWPALMAVVGIVVGTVASIISLWL